MPKSSVNASLSSYDDIFSTEESRQEEQREQVRQIPIGELFPFKNHPFKVACQFQNLSRVVAKQQRAVGDVQVRIILVKAGQDVGSFVQRDDRQLHVRGDGGKVDLAAATALRQCSTDMHINGGFLGTNNGIGIILHRRFLLFSKEKDPTGSFQFISCQRSSLC